MLYRCAISVGPNSYFCFGRQGLMMSRLAVNLLYVAKDDLNFLILLPLPLRCWFFKPDLLESVFFFFFLRQALSVASVVSPGLKEMSLPPPCRCSRPGSNLCFFFFFKAKFQVKILSKYRYTFNLPQTGTFLRLHQQGNLTKDRPRLRQLHPCPITCKT